MNKTLPTMTVTEIDGDSKQILKINKSDFDAKIHKISKVTLKEDKTSKQDKK